MNWPLLIAIMLPLTILVVVLIGNAMRREAEPASAAPRPTSLSLPEALERAAAIAAEHGHARITPVHLFVALLEPSESALADKLADIAPANAWLNTALRRLDELRKSDTRPRLSSDLQDLLDELTADGKPTVDILLSSLMRYSDAISGWVLDGPGETSPDVPAHRRAPTWPAWIRTGSTDPDQVQDLLMAHFERNECAVPVQLSIELVPGPGGALDVVLRDGCTPYDFASLVYELQTVDAVGSILIGDEQMDFQVDPASDLPEIVGSTNRGRIVVVHVPDAMFFEMKSEGGSRALQVSVDNPPIRKLQVESEGGVFAGGQGWPTS